MTKVIITGATGFVGSNLLRWLLEKDFSIHLIIRNDSSLKNIQELRDKVKIFIHDHKIERLIDFFNDVKPDLVFHLASEFIAEHKYTQIDSLIESNISFGLHLLEAMKVTGVKKLINTGTSWQHYNNQIYNPVCLYAATKQAFESLIEYYVQAEHFKVITLKLFDTYGETDTRPKLINLLNKFADENTKLKMTSGEQVLNLVHISDVCKAFEKAASLLNQQDYTGHSSFAISSNKSYKLKEVIRIFESVTGKKINVEWGAKPYRKREVMEVWKAGKQLDNWSSTISLEEGLKRFGSKK